MLSGLHRAGAVARLTVMTTVAVLAATSPGLSADFKGKNISLLISHPPGGGYDTYARLYGRHLSRVLPGQPTIVPQNMPGAAGVAMTNYLFAAANKDGTVIGLGPGSIGTSALFQASGARYDALKMSWIGSMNSEVAVGYAWHTAPIKTIQQLFTEELVIGAAGATDQSSTFPRALNTVLGLKFKIVSGYPGSNANALALERGETQGIGAMAFGSLRATRQDWVKNNKVTILVQYGLKRHAELPNVPTALEIARNEEERDVLRLVFAQTSMGRAIVGPPGMPADGLATHRTAFGAMMKDGDFLADAAKAKIEIYEPMPGEDMEKLLATLHAAKPEQLQKAIAAMLVPEERKKDPGKSK